MYKRQLETPGEPDRPREIRFILYKYEIGGVVYECSQEVTAPVSYTHLDVYKRQG